jgi:RHH-type proline utilization regulon transcriptional repressor/proline dehydrogenase/delta 1-pyrroline-5-carboxylate dehydrogenase
MLTGRPTAIDTDSVVRGYNDAWTRWFAISHDPTGLKSERNDLRYRPLTGVLVRVGPDTPDGAADAARRAAELCGTPILVSDASIEPDTALIERSRSLGVERVRMLTSATDQLRAGLNAAGIEIDDEPVSVSGRRELRRWLREQAISRTAHRHGRVAP